MYIVEYCPEGQSEPTVFEFTTMEDARTKFNSCIDMTTYCCVALYENDMLIDDYMSAEED